VAIEAEAEMGAEVGMGIEAEAEGRNDQRFGDEDEYVEEDEGCEERGEGGEFEGVEGVAEGRRIEELKKDKLGMKLRLYLKQDD
jgi:hypothetical protein